MPQEGKKKPAEVVLDGDLTIKKFAKRIGAPAGIVMLVIVVCKNITNGRTFKFHIFREKASLSDVILIATENVCKFVAFLS